MNNLLYTQTGWLEAYDGLVSKLESMGRITDRGDGTGKYLDTQGLDPEMYQQYLELCLIGARKGWM